MLYDKQYSDRERSCPIASLTLKPRSPTLTIQSEDCTESVYGRDQTLIEFNQPTVPLSHQILENTFQSCQHWIHQHFSSVLCRQH